MSGHSPFEEERKGCLRCLPRQLFLEKRQTPSLHQTPRAGTSLLPPFCPHSLRRARYRALRHLARRGPCHPHALCPAGVKSVPAASAGSSEGKATGRSCSLCPQAEVSTEGSSRQCQEPAQHPAGSASLRQGWQWGGWVGGKQGGHRARGEGAAEASLGTRDAINSSLLLMRTSGRGSCPIRWSFKLSKSLDGTERKKNASPAPPMQLPV